LSEGLK